MKKLLALSLLAFAGSFLAVFLLGLSSDVRAGGEPATAPACSARNGDVNADGGVDISDAVSILNHLFLGTPAELAPLCYTPLPPPGITAGRFVDNGDGTITDSGTGLMWQQGEGPTGNWQAAINYCAGLTLADHDDWRLPTVRELESIYLFELGARVDPVFTWERNDGTWTLTDKGINHAYSVDFSDSPSNGVIVVWQKDQLRGVRAVRVLQQPSS